MFCPWMNFSQRCSASCLILRAWLKIHRERETLPNAIACNEFENEASSVGSASVQILRTRQSRFGYGSYGYRRKESVALYREKSASRQAVHCATRDRRSLTRRMKSRQPVLDRDRELAARIGHSFDRYILLHTVSNSLFPSWNNLAVRLTPLDESRIKAKTSTYRMLSAAGKPVPLNSVVRSTILERNRVGKRRFVELRACESLTSGFDERVVWIETLHLG